MMETFSAAARGDHLERMAREPFDVLVIGGGITGAGVALVYLRRLIRSAERCTG